MAVITSTSANETLTGSAADDTYVFNDNFGHDSIVDAGGNDWIDFSNMVSVNLTIDLRSSLSHEVDLPNYVTLDWDNNAIENVIGTDGRDIIIGNTSNNILRGGLGSDRYTSFDQNATDVDIIDDAGGVYDVLTNADIVQYADFSAVDTNGNGNVDQLRIDWPNGKALLIENYFDDSSPDVSSSHAGVGSIENLFFPDEENVDFCQSPGDGEWGWTDIYRSG